MTRDWFDRALLRFFLRCCVASVLFVSASAITSAQPSSPNPTRSIPLESEGFRPLSAWEGFNQDPNTKLYESHIAVEYFDEQHVLVAFDHAGLVQRRKECPNTHHDRMVHAIVFEVPTGHITATADWYVHDANRFLYSLAGGDLLLRSGTTLSRIDLSLREHPIYDAKSLIVWAGVSPDGKRIFAEREAAAPKQGSAQQNTGYELQSIDAESGKMQASTPIGAVAPIPVSSAGFADSVRGSMGKTWLVRFGDDLKHRQPVARVKTACSPNVMFSANNTMVIGRCTSTGTKYALSSYTASGHFLWKQRWDDTRYDASVATSASGKRFAYSSMTRREKEPSAEGDSEVALQAWVQHVAVLDTATGHRVLDLETTPAVLAGQNVALSPSGLQLAMLRGSTLEFYSLPAPTREDELQFASVQADAPGLTAPAAIDETYQELANAIDDAPTKSAENSEPQLATLAAPVALPSASSPAPATPEPTTGSTDITPAATFRSSTQAVVLEVVVTDRKGNLIPDLKPEQFAINEDGTSQKLRYFEEHSAERKETPHVADATARPSNAFTNQSQTPELDSTTMILLDYLNTPVEDQLRARAELIKFIESRPKNESFALCVLGENIRLVRGFTTDENQLLEAMNDRRMRTRFSKQLQVDSARTALIQNLTQVLQQMEHPDPLLHDFLKWSEQSVIDERAQKNDSRVLLTINAFEQLSTYLSGIPGRKNLVWISSAFPTFTFGNTTGQGLNPLKQTRDWSPRVRHAMNLLAAAHVAVYPVDIRGVQTDTMFDMTTTTTQVGIQGEKLDNLANTPGQHLVRQPEFLTTNRDNRLSREADHSTMDTVASLTGGKAFYGSNDLAGAMRTAVTHGTEYYTLSYNPANKVYDGRFRNIKVAVPGHTDYKLAYRNGYYADDPDKPLAKIGNLQDRLVSGVMAHGAPASAQIPFMVRVTPVGSPKTVNAQQAGFRVVSKKNTPAMNVKVQHYYLDYAIAGTQLRFQAAQDNSIHGRLRFLMNAFDNDGRVLMQASSTAMADLNSDQYKSILRSGFRTRQQLDIPTDVTSIRLGVEDTTNGHIGSIEIALPVQVPKDEPLARKSSALPPVEQE